MGCNKLDFYMIDNTVQLKLKVGSKTTYCDWAYHSEHARPPITTLDWVITR